MSIKLERETAELKWLGAKSNEILIRVREIKIASRIPISLQIQETFKLKKVEVYVSRLDFVFGDYAKRVYTNRTFFFWLLALEGYRGTQWQP